MYITSAVVRRAFVDVLATLLLDCGKRLATEDVVEDAHVRVDGDRIFIGAEEADGTVAALVARLLVVACRAVPAWVVCRTL